MLNSRLTPFAAAPNRPQRAPGHPFFRSYGANLPSSLRGVHSRALVCSTHPPVSVCGTGDRGKGRGAFLGAPGQRIRQGPQAPASAPLLTRGATAPFGRQPPSWGRVPPRLLTPAGAGILTRSLHRGSPSAAGLGPDSPWADEPCPGTLGFTAAGTLTRLVATHVCILTWAGSTGGPPPASALSPTFPYRA